LIALLVAVIPVHAAKAASSSWPGPRFSRGREERR
jgi:hypothetical protein